MNKIFIRKLPITAHGDKYVAFTKEELFNHLSCLSNLYKEGNREPFFADMFTDLRKNTVEDLCDHFFYIQQQSEVLSWHPMFFVNFLAALKGRMSDMEYMLVVNEALGVLQIDIASGTTNGYAFDINAFHKAYIAPYAGSGFN